MERKMETTIWVQGYIEVIVETQMEKKMDMSWKLDFTPVF